MVTHLSASKLCWDCPPGSMQASRRAGRKMKGFLMFRFKPGPLPLHPYSVGESKSQDTEADQIQEMVKWTLIFDKKSEESHCRHHGYRKSETTVAIFIVNLPITLFLFYFTPNILFLDTMLWETSFSWKVVMARCKYESLSSKPSFYGLFLTPYTRLFWCQVFTWFFLPLLHSSLTVLHTPKTEWAGSNGLLQHSGFICSLTFSHVLSFLSLGEPLSWH